MNQRIDIAMTAVLRPVVVERTIASIVRQICGSDIDRFNLVINVDPVGEDVPQSVIVDIAKKYFPNAICNTPKKASFPSAVRWVWNTVSTPYVFHTEDDFEIVKHLDINHMTCILDRHPRIGSLRLCRGVDWDNPYDDMHGDKIKRGKCLWIYQEDGFFLSPNWIGQFALNPSLMRLEFMRGITPFFKEGIDPERVTFFSPHVRKVLNKKEVNQLSKHLSSWRVGMYAVPLSLRDQGRPWRKIHHLGKSSAGIPRTWKRTKK